jgi:hypothetical protein
MCSFRNNRLLEPVDITVTATVPVADELPTALNEAISPLTLLDDATTRESAVGVGYCGWHPPME